MVSFFVRMDYAILLLFSMVSFSPETEHFKLDFFSVMVWYIHVHVQYMCVQQSSSAGGVVMESDSLAAAWGTWERR